MNTCFIHKFTHLNIQSTQIIHPHWFILLIHTRLLTHINITNLVHLFRKTVSDLSIDTPSADSLIVPDNENKEENRKRTAEEMQCQEEIAREILGFVDDLSSDSHDGNVLLTNESNDLKDVRPLPEDVIVPVPIERSTSKKFGVSLPGTRLTVLMEAIPLPKKRQPKKPLVRKVANIVAQPKATDGLTASTSAQAIVAAKKPMAPVEKSICYGPIDPNRQPSLDIVKFNHSQVTSYLNQPPQQPFPPPQHFAPNQFAPTHVAPQPQYQYSDQQFYGPPQQQFWPPPEQFWPPLYFDPQNYGPQQRFLPPDFGPPQYFGPPFFTPQQFESSQFRALFPQPKININTNRPINVHFNCAPGKYPPPLIQGLAQDPRRPQLLRKKKMQQQHKLKYVRGA